MGRIPIQSWLPSEQGCDPEGKRRVEEEGGAAKTGIHLLQPAWIELPLPELFGEVMTEDEVVPNVVTLGTIGQQHGQYQQQGCAEHNEQAEAVPLSPGRVSRHLGLPDLFLALR